MAVAIACAMRQNTPLEKVELARIAGSFAGRGVVGFDLADEVRYPASPHVRNRAPDLAPSRLAAASRRPSGSDRIDL